MSPTVLVLLLVIGAFQAPAFPAPAQDSGRVQSEEPAPATRAELLRRRREAKRKTAHPPELSSVEQQFLRLDKAETPAITDVNWRGFYPRLAWPARGSGAALGVRYWQPDLVGPIDVAGAAFYSWRGYQHYDVQLGLMPHVGDRIPQRSWKGDDVYELGSQRPRFLKVPFYVTLRHRYLPDEDYYGSGPDSSLEDRTSYLQEETRIYLRTGVQLGEHVALIGNGGYQRNRVDLGTSRVRPSTQSRFDEAAAPGILAAPSYTRYGGQLFVDFRDEPGNPHRGGMLAASLERFDDDGRGSFSFDRVGVDLRGFLPLGSPQRVLALRASGIWDDPKGGARVPFFMQESLGGSHTLRGFDSFRFRGERVLLLQAEYRWEPVSFWELAVFTDTGTVSDSETSFDLSKLEWDYGFGTRFKTYRDIVLRLEIAFSRETTRYFIRGSSSF